MSLLCPKWSLELGYLQSPVCQEFVSREQLWGFTTPSAVTTEVSDSWLLPAQTGVMGMLLNHEADCKTCAVFLWLKIFCLPTILSFSKEIKVLGGGRVCTGCIRSRPRLPRVCLCPVCFRRSPGCWRVSCIYTASFSLQLADSQSSVAARVDSPGLLWALWHAARWSGHRPVCPYPPGTAVLLLLAWSRPSVFFLQYHKPTAAQTLSVRSLLIQVCI